MVQVAIFEDELEEDLSDAINTFIRLHPHFQILDVKFQTQSLLIEEDEYISTFSALVLYRMDNSL